MVGVNISAPGHASLKNFLRMQKKVVVFFKKMINNHNFLKL